MTTAKVKPHTLFTYVDSATLLFNFSLIMNSSKKKINNNDKQKSLSNNLYAERYSIMRQIGHQFKTENTLGQIDKTVEGLFRKTKADIEFSGVLNTQLKNSRDDFGCKVTRTADQDIDRELNVFTSRRAILSTQYMECPTCLEKILIHNHDDHVRVCTSVHLSGKGVDSRKTKAIERNDKNIAVRPHQIRNLRLIGVTFDAIHIVWDLPIFDGGEPLIDFELSYFCDLEKIPDNRGRNKRISMSCLRWYNKEPIIAESFILDGLSASTQYLGIRMRCKNRIGWSDYSTPIDVVKTAGNASPLCLIHVDISDQIA